MEPYTWFCYITLSDSQEANIYTDIDSLHDSTAVHNISCILLSRSLHKFLSSLNCYVWYGDFTAELCNVWYCSAHKLWLYAFDLWFKSYRLLFNWGVSWDSSTYKCLLKAECIHVRLHLGLLLHTNIERMYTVWHKF